MQIRARGYNPTALICNKNILPGSVDSLHHSNDNTIRIDDIIISDER